MIHTITIPNWRPCSDNELRGHWAVASRRKHGDMAMIGTYAHRYKVPPAHGKRLVEIEINVSGRGRAIDPSNIFKSTFDALKNLKLIIDDSDKWLDFTKPKITRAPLKSTTIRITDI